MRYTTNFEAVTEGTYYIQNVYTGKYLCASGSSVYLSDYGNGGTAVKWTVQKNAYYPSTYNIVPNGNTSLGLYFNMDYGTITLPAKASDGFGRWQFEKLDNGSYLIMSAGRPWMSLTGSGTSVYPSVTNTDTLHQWVLIPKGEITPQSKELYIGDTYDLDNISVFPATNLTWSIVSGAQYVNYDTSTNEILAKLSGTTVFETTLLGVTHQFTVNILQSQPLADGIYYIKNYFSEKYVDTANHNVSNGTSVNQWSKLDDTYSQLWEVEYAGNGGYYISPVDNTLLKMTALSNTSGDNYDVKLSSGSTSKWAIVEYGSGLYNVVPLDYPDKALGIDPTALNDGIGVVAQNRIYGSNNQKWMFESFEVKKAVILIHGRDSNSDGCWGAGNSIVEGMNDDYKVEEGIDYTDVPTQAIITDTIDNDHEEGGNLAYELRDNGYIPNVNLFVFNYPNQGLVFNNALLFEEYVNNLMSSVRNSNSDLRKQVFSLNGDNFTFNIVGHSMGGLVARYYIENLEQDEHVEKLITIDTPHWGCDLADIANFAPWVHYRCDHDLETNSAMFHSSLEDNYYCLWCSREITDSTEILNYQLPRQTKYYAIAGVDFFNNLLPNEEDIGVDLPTNFTTYAQLTDCLIAEGGENLYRGESVQDGVLVPGEYINIFSAKDTLVKFLSQIGWSENVSSLCPDKIIDFEEIFVLIDTNGGNTLYPVSLLHSKVQHRNKVMDKILVYLG